MKRHGLLIVDDEKEILRSLTLTFADDYAVFTASSGAEALEILEKQEIALVIADQRMPVMTGAELLERVFQINSNIIRIILTGYTDTASLIQAINKGHIYQYITKPWERQDLRITVKRAVESYELALENKRLLRELQAANERLKDENIFLRSEVRKEWQCADIIGQSPVMQKVFSLVNRVLDNSATVLLTGETGTSCLSSRTVELSLKCCLKASCLVTSAALSPARSRIGKGCSKSPMAALYYWTKSAR